MTTSLSQRAANVNWLIDDFVSTTPGVTDSIVVSSDGLALAASSGLDRDSIDRFSAVASGLIGLAFGVAQRFDGGGVREVVIDMERALLFVTGVSDGSLLAVVARSDADVGQVGYAMSRLVERCGAVLTPELRHELQAALPR